jgi:DNA-binding SARP family transcriptional activator
MGVELRLLAGARVVLPRGEVRTLERKTAALLAVLALEQSAARARASCLLWPESPDKTARANLRQLIRRLRLAAREDLVEGKDPLRLSSSVEVDALLGTNVGELLAGYEYDDCPEFAEWLAVRREQCRGLQRAALTEAAEALEQQGKLHAALDAARKLTIVHPESEHGHQRVMRLCHALGDRPAALHAYDIAERALRKLCGSAPSPQTHELLSAIRADGASDGPVTQQSRSRDYSHKPDRTKGR